MRMQLSKNIMLGSDTMSNYNYDSYCGLYCGACDIIMAYKNGYEDKIAPYLNVEPSQIKCHGCKTDTLFVNCENCKIRNCVINKNMEHCIDCDNFPCSFFDENTLPHWKIVHKNLTIIKNVGVNQWLAEQEKQWKCPECQTDFSWYATNCISCGKDLEKIKDYNKI